MAEERRRFLGELTAWQVSMIAGMFGAKLDPTEINPYRVWTAAELAKRAAFERQRFWAAVGGKPALADAMRTSIGKVRAAHQETASTAEEMAEP